MTESQIKKAFASNRNIFLTGAAGTGKTYYLNQYMAENPDLNFIVCAPTGLAALNLGGDTMHKVFHIPVPAFESPSFAKGKKGAITQSMLKPLIEADVIIIDEISMARNDTFSFAIKVIRKAERLKGNKIRIIVCGDFSQLPPVVKKTDEKLMKKAGFDVSGFAFTTSEWKSCNFKVIELSEVKRQKDTDFINELNKVRIGDYSNIEYFNQFVTENPDYDDAICICGTNAEADKINQDYLDSVDGYMAVLRAEKEGRCSMGIIDDMIIVKVGCRVIFTSNDNIRGKFKNGTFGRIVAIKDDCVAVDIDGKVVDVYKMDYSMYSYSVTGNTFTKKEVGKIRQYPFKIGKAITIHKSQGQTFEKAVISPKVFAAGQLYVALSRVTSPDGLQLTEPLSADMLILNEVVEEFYRNGYKFDVKPAKKTKVTVKTVKKSTSKAKKKTTTVAKKPTKKTATKSATKTTKKAATKKSSGSKTKSKTASASKSKSTASKKSTTKKTTTAKKSVTKKTPSTKRSTVKKPSKTASTKKTTSSRKTASKRQIKATTKVSSTKRTAAKKVASKSKTK